MLNVNIKGDYAIKFRVFGITLGTIHGSVNDTFPIPEDKLNFTRSFSVGSAGSIVANFSGDTLTVSAVLGGVYLFSQQFSLAQLAAGKSYTLKGFNHNGITVSDVVLSVL